MENKNINARFHIYTGYREGSIIKNELQAGEAYEVVGVKRPYYLVKMWAFPRDEFYLSPNRDDSGAFTLFAKKIGEEFDPTFRRPSWLRIRVAGFAQTSRNPVHVSAPAGLHELVPGQSDSRQSSFANRRSCLMELKPSRPLIVLYRGTAVDTAVLAGLAMMKASVGKIALTCDLTPAVEEYLKELNPWLARYGLPSVSIHPPFNRDDFGLIVDHPEKQWNWSEGECRVLLTLSGVPLPPRPIAS